MIIDTSVFVDVIRDYEPAVEKLERLEAEPEQHRVSSVTVYELVVGIAGAENSSREQRRIEGVLESKPVVAADETVMRKAGHRNGDLQARGVRVGDLDAIVAATADVLEEPVLTRDVDEFERLGVEVETY